MFQISEFTEARVASITNRVEKHGDDEKPAVSIGVEITAANTMLDAIDRSIREALFRAKPDAEPELPGVEPSTPVLRCHSIERVTLATRHEGWTLAIDTGIDDAKPMKFVGVKVDKLSVEPKHGGSIVLRLRLGTCDVDAQRLGWLGMHNGESIWITLTPPERAPEAIDGTTGHPGAQPGGATVEDLFAAAGDDDEADPVEDAEDAGPELEDRLDNALRAADAERAWAFDPARADPPSPSASASPRTERGRAATKKALAEGLAAAQAAGLA